MVGKTVKIIDPALVSFLYPNYVVRSELTLMDRDEDVIYIGSSKQNINDYLSKRVRNYISLVGQPDLDLSTKRALLEWSIEKTSKRIPKKVLDEVESMDDYQFLYCFKTYWILGRWPSESCETETGLFDLFKTVSSGSLRDTLSIAFKLYDDIPYPVLESSFLTFLQRVKSVDEQTVNPSYIRVLKSASARFGAKINRSVVSYSNQKDLRDDLMFLSLILSLR